MRRHFDEAGPPLVTPRSRSPSPSTSADSARPAALAGDARPAAPPPCRCARTEHTTAARRGVGFERGKIRLGAEMPDVGGARTELPRPPTCRGGRSARGAGDLRARADAVAGARRGDVLERSTRRSTRCSRWWPTFCRRRARSRWAARRPSSESTSITSSTTSAFVDLAQPLMALGSHGSSDASRAASKLSGPPTTRQRRAAAAALRPTGRPLRHAAGAPPTEAFVRDDPPAPRTRRGA